jgi:V8-like Glu-specific endopeptidase
VAIIENTTARQLITQHDTYHGQSGSPIYTALLWRYIEHAAVGMHSRTTGSGCPNLAVRVTEYMQQKVREWDPVRPVHHCYDERKRKNTSTF